MIPYTSDLLQSLIASQYTHLSPLLFFADLSIKDKIGARTIEFWAH